jgi:hypothetical protein
MQNKLNKNKAISIALIVILMTSLAMMLTMQPAKAYKNTVYSTYTYVFPGQPVVGVGQTILIEMYLNVYPPTASGSMGDRWDFYLTITSPSGINETKGPITSDPVGGAFITYVPTEVGTYTIQASFPGDTLTGAPGNTGNANVDNVYNASLSRPNTFIAQQDAIPTYQETPLPTDYWTRPVYDVNRGWGNVAMGQWLGGNYYETQLRQRGLPNQEGPESSHVLWSTSSWLGGIMGGYDDTGYYNGIAYEGFSSPLIVLEGKAYYSDQHPPRYGWYCIDLYTGNQLFYVNNTDGTQAIPSLGQVLNYDSPNQHGGFANLYATSGVSLPAGNTNAVGLSAWEMFDAYSGKSICKIANVSTTGTQFRDSIGSICYANIANLAPAGQTPNYYLQIWNSTQAVWWRTQYGVAYPATLINGTSNVPNIDTGDNAYWFWRPGTPGNVVPGMSTTTAGAIYNGYNGYTMNISIASLNGPRNSVLNETASVRDIFPGDEIVVGTAGRNDVRGNAPGSIWAYSLKDNTWGNISWSVNFNAPYAADPVGANTTNGGGLSFGISVQNNVFWYTERVTGKVWVYSLSTGNQLWTYTEPNQFAFQGFSFSAHNGKIYTMGSMGQMHCFDALTGESLWNWTAPLLGNLEGQGLTYTPLSLCFYVDNNATGRNLIYLHGSTGWAGETTPIRRDGAIFCIDGDTGELVWRLMAYPNTANNALSKVVMSDSRILYLDNHDNQIYCLGRGPSATTVSAPQLAPVLGAPVTITGTVTDQSPSGKHNINGDLDIALKGTPAINDASMDAWMEYMFHQRPIPANATGVPVTLTAVDPNGNLVNVGNTTSDKYGNYGLSYTPEVSGKYQIIATFAGSNSYGPSSSTTYLTVAEGPTLTPAPTPLAQSVADTYIVPGIIAIIIVIVLVGVANILLLRKRA